MTQTDLAKDLKNISEKDRKQIEQAQEMLGPDPKTMGFVKNIFWGNFRQDLVFPYPTQTADENARCEKLLAELDVYLRNEHPSVEIDQKQEIPEWVVKRLFDMGVLGMTITKEHGGLGFGITSYNRVLRRIGRTCGSTAVLVSAHQSIGCKALMLFGNEEQKARFLPRMAKDALSAFCLSEPNVGCDAGGQETRCVLSDCGNFYILNGEKKWATSGAISALFTVMAKQKITDPKTGKEKDAVTALICTPDMEGVEIFSRNRSKCGIRGTWQARIRLTNVKVPKENLLHKEGRGLNVALTGTVAETKLASVLVPAGAMGTNGLIRAESVWSNNNSANNNVNFLKGRYDVIVSDYLTDTDNWFMVDSKYMKMFLKWYDRIPSEFNKDKDFDTYVAKYSAYMRYSFGFSDARWIYGMNVT
jgi:hypothetical protein